MLWQWPCDGEKGECRRSIGGIRFHFFMAGPAKAHEVFRTLVEKRAIIQVMNRQAAAALAMLTSPASERKGAVAN